MALARNRLLELSSLGSGSSARLHFLSITQGVIGSGSFIASELEIDIMEIDVEIDMEEQIQITLQDSIEIQIEDTIEVEVY